MTTHEKLLEEIKALHARKKADYAQGGNPYSNFERAGEIASWFQDPVDRTFATLIGVKLARIAELTIPGRKPNNESLDDSFVDLTNYCAIWTAYRRDRLGASSADPPVVPRVQSDPPPVHPILRTHRFLDMGRGFCGICMLDKDEKEKRISRGCLDG